MEPNTTAPVTSAATQPPVSTPTLIEAPSAEAIPPAARRTIPRHYIAFAAGLIISLALGYFFFGNEGREAAAVVNGTKITKAEVAESAEMMAKSAALQGIDITDPAVVEELDKQALENLINNELLLGAARSAGMTANEAAVKSAYDALVAQVGGEEELATRMETVGLNTDTLMGNITDRLIVDQYIESVTDIETLTVTEEELGAYLASIVTEGVELPPLEEIKPQIEASLLEQKQNAVVADLLLSLRSEAEIEIR